SVWIVLSSYATGPLRLVAIGRGTSKRRGDASSSGTHIHEEDSHERSLGPLPVRRCLVRGRRTRARARHVSLLTASAALGRERQHPVPRAGREVPLAVGREGLGEVLAAERLVSDSLRALRQSAAVELRRRARVGSSGTDE